MSVENYLPLAREHEKVFRAILQDLKGRKAFAMPDGFDITVSLEQIFEQYSSGERNDRFTLLNFQRISSDTVTISFEKINYQFRGGNGVELRYKIGTDTSVKFDTELLDGS